MANYSIIHILEKYDDNMEINNKLFKKLNKYNINYWYEQQIIGFSTSEHNYNNEALYKYEYKYKYKYQLLGTYNTKYKIWLWGWARIQKNINYSKKLLLYGLELGNNTNIDDKNNTNFVEHKDIDLIRNTLITSRILITDDIQIEIFIALASYLTGITKIYPAKKKNKDGSYTIHYLFLIDLE
jgi:hypothetical protein